MLSTIGISRVKHIVIMPDQDEAGMEHGNNVARHLATVAASVRIINVPTGKDVTDWKESGATAEDLLRLTEAAPIYQPLSPPIEQTPVEVIPAKGVATEEFERLLHSDVGKCRTVCEALRK